MLWCVLFVCVFVVQANTDTTPKLEPVGISGTTNRVKADQGMNETATARLRCVRDSAVK